MVKLADFLLPNAPTCIVACSATTARLWISTARFGDWTLLAQLHEPRASDREAAFSSDRPGRSFDSFGSGRHAMAAGESGREHQVRIFARRIADYLNRGIATRDFSNIVLIAAPATLGFVRAALSDAARRAVALEAPKNLTDLDVDAIRSYFK